VVRSKVRAYMADIERLSTADIVAELHQLDPFGLHKASDGRVALMNTLLRFYVADGGPLLPDEGWSSE
jgi:hypothetical protein